MEFFINQVGSIITIWKKSSKQDYKEKKRCAFRRICSSHVLYINVHILHYLYLFHIEQNYISRKERKKPIKRNNEKNLTKPCVRQMIKLWIKRNKGENTTFYHENSAWFRLLVVFEEENTNIHIHKNTLYTQIWKQTTKRGNYFLNSSYESLVLETRFWYSSI